MNDYERTWDEDEEYGLHDIQVEGYEEEGLGSGAGAGSAGATFAEGDSGQNPNRALTHTRWGPGACQPPEVSV